MQRAVCFRSPIAARSAVAAAACAALTLAGCAGIVKTPYQRPAVELPSRWQQGAAATAPRPVEPNAAWWTDFGDARLTRLVETALSRNNDLAAAMWRVREAGLQAELAASALRPTPTVGISSSLARSRGIDARSSGLSIGASYEADLWGRLASARDAQQWEALATEQDRDSAALALAGTTANLYWQIAYLNEQLASSRESLAYAERTRALVRAQYRAGSVSSLELRQTDETVASQLAARTQLVQQRIEARNALAVLFDAPPGDAVLAALLPEEPPMLPLAAPPDLEAGLPADLLARRPDLRAAELRLRKTLALGDSTRASYYPTLSLTGSYGTSSAALLNLVSNPVTTIGAQIALPFLRFNDMRLDNALVRAEYDEAVVRFRQTLYQSFADVENALSSRTQFQQQGLALEAQLAAARDTERLYEVRYRAGASTLQVWLDAQERRRSAELGLSANRLSRLNAQVAVYKALGGSARTP